MKKLWVILLVMVVGVLIVVGTAHKPQPDPVKIAERHAAFEAAQAEHQKTVDFCVENSKPFSTTVSYDQDQNTQWDNGIKACMREHGVKGYEDAPLPTK